MAQLKEAAIAVVVCDCCGGKKGQFPGGCCGEQHVIMHFFSWFEILPLVFPCASSFCKQLLPASMDNYFVQR